MTEVDFTSDLWLFLSPWCEEKLEDDGYVDAIALAWVALWNYTIDPTSMKTGEIRRVCKGLFDIPTNELIEILHEFEIDGERYGDPELLDDGFEDFDCVDTTVTKISQIVPKDGKRFDLLYQYDFGDDWKHEVVFEGCLRAESGQRYPLCIEGERACPPEDVGGVWGYAEYLEAMADPNHERHQEFMEWRGRFDPELFDAAKTTKAMRRGLPDWRRM